MKQIKIDSFLEFQYISAPSFSPHGDLAAFVVQQADLEENRYSGDLYILDVQTKQVRRLTSGGDARSYIWTQKGTLLFPAMRDSQWKQKKSDGEPVSCWYEIDPRGGEASLALVLPLNVKELCQIDADRWLVTATQDNNLPDLEGLSEEARKNALKEHKSVGWDVFEEAPFWANGSGLTAGKRSRLYVYTQSTGDLKPLTEPWFQTDGVDLRGNKVLIKGQSWQGFLTYKYQPGYWLLDLETGETRCLVEPGTFRSGKFVLLDEKTALVAATDDAVYGLERYYDFCLLDLQTGELTVQTPYELPIGSSTLGSDARLGGGRTEKLEGNTFYFVSTQDDGSYLCSIDRNGVLSDRLTPDGSCSSFDVFEDHILVCAMYGDKLAELYLDGEQVTFFNEAWSGAHSVITPEYHSFTASDGFEIHGFALKPAGYVPGRQYPAILNIHGGPRTTFGSVFHHEMQMWANAGYFVFYCNPRGSDGRGNAFGCIGANCGRADYENIMEFLDEMLKKYPDVDEAKLGVTGGSYGGFMTNWIIGHTNRFAAAASQRSIANWISFEHTSDIGVPFTKKNVLATTRESMEMLWDDSPLKYADRCTTPTLFIHSDQDYRCWMVEGLSMFTALKIHGCPARMCLFKGENHELSRSGKPRNRIRRMEEILNWMDQYLK